VKRAIASGGPYTVIASGLATPTYTDSAVTIGTTYFYVVTAVNIGGESPDSAKVNATPLPPPPAAPTNLTPIVVSKSQINLTWVDNASNESGYRIERSTNGTSFSQIATTGANVSSFSNTGLAANTTYYYRVRAFNGGGNSAYSAVVSATTLR
jgi:fibronectin type 3 domain-containing protein